jgi:hypothetical protein
MSSVDRFDSCHEQSCSCFQVALVDFGSAGIPPMIPSSLSPATAIPSKKRQLEPESSAFPQMHALSKDADLATPPEKRSHVEEVDKSTLPITPFRPPAAVDTTPATFAVGADGKQIMVCFRMALSCRFQLMPCLLCSITSTFREFVRHIGACCLCCWIMGKMSLSLR